jgi:thiosulfate dehydrogenase [quinone] large subunit
MSTIDGRTGSSTAAMTTTSHRSADVEISYGPTAWFLALARIAVGFTFLWAFYDKAFRAVGATATGDLPSWRDGGSPTRGFLGNAATGPFESLYKNLAGTAFADWAFMLALLFGGVALMLGIASRAASIGAGLLLLLMWTVVLPPANNPFIDEHVVQALAMFAIAFYLPAQHFLGLQGMWNRAVADRLPVLR